MLFNSLSFALFLPIVFCLYWFITNKSLLAQQSVLLIASYFFYACWNWHFLFLLIFSTALDFFTGSKIDQANNFQSKRIWLWISIVINLGLLGVFKYYNFFASSFAKFLSVFHIPLHPYLLQIILPVGISFYTFHGLSYVIDIYYNRIKPEKSILTYSLFVCFFPLLVAGPIERATHLLTQLSIAKKFNYQKAIEGLRQILWGLFKKVVIADGCAPLVNKVFGNAGEVYSGSSHVVAACLFSIQIYCDFSGYTDMALGTARLFGIELLQNFAFPYFSRDVAEFWRRWHISLSAWFRDYVYIPLGGSRLSMIFTLRNTLIVFVISGFWHGANYTFIIWGLLHALFMFSQILLKRNRIYLNKVAYGKSLPSFKEAIQILATFCLITFAWIFFRSPSLSDALHFIRPIFSKSLLQEPFPGNMPLRLFAFIGFLFIMEWMGRNNLYALEKLENQLTAPFRWLVYYGLILAIIFYGGMQQPFIYFQF